MHSNFINHKQQLYNFKLDHAQYNLSTHDFMDIFFFIY